VLCVLRSGDSFLLLKRLKAPNTGMYTPVGGKLDPYETPSSAAVRETMEETGIVVSGMKYCGVLVETSPTDYNWTSFVYLADVAYVAPPDCTEGKLEWVPFKDLRDLETPATDWFIYQYIAAAMPFVFNAVFDDALNLLSMQDELTGKVLV